MPTPSSAACSSTPALGALRPRPYQWTDAGELDRDLRHAGRRPRRAVRPACPPTPPSASPAHDLGPGREHDRYPRPPESRADRAAPPPPGTPRVDFTIDVNLTDGQVHDLALYAVDWDNAGGASRSSSSTPPPAPCWAPRTLSSFTDGEYLQWAVSGNVVIKVTNLGRAQRRHQRAVPRSGHHDRLISADRHAHPDGQHDGRQLDRHLRHPGL